MIQNSTNTFTVSHPLLHTTRSPNPALLLSFHPTQGWLEGEAGIVSYLETWFEEKPALTASPAQRVPPSHHGALLPARVPKACNRGRKDTPRLPATRSQRATAPDGALRWRKPHGRTDRSAPTPERSRGGSAGTPQESGRGAAEPPQLPRGTARGGGKEGLGARPESGRCPGTGCRCPCPAREPTSLRTCCGSRLRNQGQATNRDTGTAPALPAASAGAVACTANPRGTHSSAGDGVCPSEERQPAQTSPQNTCWTVSPATAKVTSSLHRTVDVLICQRLY